jgi:hypothetical protein
MKLDYEYAQDTEKDEEESDCGRFEGTAQSSISLS